MAIPVLPISRLKIPRHIGTYLGIRPRIGTYLGWAIELDSTETQTNPNVIWGSPWRITVYRDEPEPKLIDLGVNVGTPEDAEAFAIAWIDRVATLG